MAAKSSKKAKGKMVKITAHLGSGRESKLADFAAGRVKPEKVTVEVEGTGIGDGCEADKPGQMEEASAALDALATKPPEPQALTLPLLTDSATLFIQGVQQLTAQLLGQPECAPLLVKVNEWLKGLETVKKLIVGNDDAIEGLKKLVIETGQPWGEKGSKQLVLAGARVPVKAINYRAPGAQLTINDLDASKVEAYLRGNAVDPEKTLAGYMKATTVWGLKDLSPLQAKNLNAMLSDPGEWGQGLRQCLKDTKYQMMAPEMEGA